MSAVATLDVLPVAGSLVIDVDRQLRVVRFRAKAEGVEGPWTNWYPLPDEDDPIPLTWDRLWDQ